MDEFDKAIAAQRAQIQEVRKLLNQLDSLVHVAGYRKTVNEIRMMMQQMDVNLGFIKAGACRICSLEHID